MGKQHSKWRSEYLPSPPHSTHMTHIYKCIWLRHRPRPYYQIASPHVVDWVRRHPRCGFPTLEFGKTGYFAAKSGAVSRGAPSHDCHDLWQWQTVADRMLGSNFPNLKTGHTASICVDCLHRFTPGFCVFTYWNSPNSSFVHYNQSCLKVPCYKWGGCKEILSPHFAIRILFNNY